MKDRVRFAVLVAAVSFAAACTQSHTPTSPSRASSLNDSTSLASSPLGGWVSQASGGLAVTWSCLTAGVGCPVRPMPGMGVEPDPPGAPSNLAFQVSGTTVILTWSPPGPGPEVSSYVVEAGTGPGLSNIARFDTGTIATTLTVTSVPAGTYVVRVRAANLAGTGGACGSGTPGPTPNTCMGAASNEVTIVVTTGPCPPPGAPSGLFQSVSGNTVMLSWNAFTGAIAYIIEAGSASGASNIASFDTGSAATSFSANAPNGTYFIRIRVRTACGTSGVSNEVIATVGGGAPPPPGGGLSGLWQGSITPRLSGTQQVDFTESGTSLTGSVRNRPAGQAITFELTKHPITLGRYDGNLIFEGTGAGACGAGPQAGFVNVFTGPARMTGSFTAPAAGACPSQTTSVDLLKQ